MEAAAKAILHAVAAIAWLIDRLDELDTIWPKIWEGIAETFREFVNEVIEGINTIIRGLNKIPGVDLEELTKWVRMGPTAPNPPLMHRTPHDRPWHKLDDDSAIGSLATDLGSIGGGNRTFIFNVENLYGVDDLEDFVQEANLLGQRMGREDVLT